MLVYVRIPEDAAIDVIFDAAKEMFENGITPVTALPGNVSPFEAIQRCDAIVQLPTELTEPLFENQGLPVYFWPEMPKRAHTEVRYPQQVTAFITKLMRMYKVHLRKNEDYSPANIMGAGEIGIITRLWDKMARLMNLSGFDLEIGATKYREPKEPKHESIEDNAMDLAVYAIIFQLYREGKWAK